MTQYCLLKGGRSAGYIDITYKGFTIRGDGDLAERFDEMASDFVRTGFSKHGDHIDYSFTSTAPPETMIEMLVRLKSELDFLGYELVTY